MSNNPPFPEQLEEIQLFHEQIQAKLSGNQDEIRLLEEKLEKSKRQQKQLQKQSLRCEVFKSPFRHLTTDIIYRISKSCPLYDTYRDLPTHEIHTPTALSHVCRAWHQTVHGMSMLWKYFRAIWKTPDAQPEVNLQWQCRFEHFARLSRVLPLNVACWYDAQSSNGNLEVLPFVDWIVRRCCEDSKALRRLLVSSPKNSTEIVLRQLVE